ncbi:MAG: hypothetical protein K5858_04280 [Lachnospiraceae bacterium]|nr:hypothetical protein [Lachnospiraceae bacterium]
MKKLYKLLSILLIFSLLLPAIRVNAAEKTLKLSAKNAKKGVITISKGSYDKVTLKANTAGLKVKIKGATIKALSIQGDTKKVTKITASQSNITKISASASFSLSGSGNTVGTINLLSDEITGEVNVPVSTISIVKGTKNISLKTNSDVETIKCVGETSNTEITSGKVSKISITGASTTVSGTGTVDRINISAPKAKINGLNVQTLYSKDMEDATYNDISLIKGSKHPSTVYPIDGVTTFDDDVELRHIGQALYNTPAQTVIINSRAYTENTFWSLEVPEGKTLIFGENAYIDTKPSSKVVYQSHIYALKNSEIVIEGENPAIINKTDVCFHVGKGGDASVTIFDTTIKTIFNETLKDTDDDYLGNGLWFHHKYGKGYGGGNKYEITEEGKQKLIEKGLEFK